MSGVKSFGSFRLDIVDHSLWRNGERVSITPKAYDVLRYFVEHPGRLVTPDEMLEAVWRDTYVNPEVLRKYILEIRKALGDKPNDPQFVETVPKRGYRFVARVGDEVTVELGASPTETPSATPLSETVATLLGETQVSPPIAERMPANTKSRLWRIALLLIVLAGGVLVMVRRPTRASKLTEKDTVVLADFVNSTGDPVFDGTLRQGLSAQLEQSPFLNLLSDERTAQTLSYMAIAKDTRTTGEVAREVCQRTRSAATVEGSIGSLGNQYVLGLKAASCSDGKLLAEEQVTANSKEQVLQVLGHAATELRTKLGESLASVEKYDVPLVNATTPSLDALKAYSLGLKVFNEHGSTDSMRLFARAIELDSNFAMGYRALGADYSNLGQVERGREYYTKAFHLREHASERERLAITADYYFNVTGELQKASQTYQEELQIYPRANGEYGNLGAVYSLLGQYEKAAEITQEAVRAAPDQASNYGNLANYSMALERFDRAREVIEEARARKLDNGLFHIVLYALAFIQGDSSAMAEQQQWLRDQPGYDNFGLMLASQTEESRGHLTKARELTKQAVDSAVKGDDKESAAIWEGMAGEREAAYGNLVEARQYASKALKLAPAGQGVELEAALAFAMAGDTVRAESLAEDVAKRFPLDTQTQSLWLPTIKAQLALDRKNSAAALNTLQAASPVEFGNIQFASNISCLYPVYIRGEAYLAAGQGIAAAGEFQKILAHSGIVWNCWTGALANLGVARAKALQSKTLQVADASAARNQAVAAYREFFTLWKDSDRNLPILRQARAEYEKLQ